MLLLASLCRALMRDALDDPEPHTPDKPVPLPTCEATVEQGIRLLQQSGCHHSASLPDMQAQKSPGRCRAFELLKSSRDQYFATKGHPS